LVPEKHCVDLFYNNKLGNMKEIFNIFKETYRKNPGDFIASAVFGTMLFVVGYILITLAAVMD
jgi:hypothetical protein